MVNSKVPLDQPTLNVVESTPILNIESTDKNGQKTIEAKAVVVVDPITGKALGASDFFRLITWQPQAYRAANLTQNQWYDLWTGLAIAAGAGTAKTNVHLYSLSFTQLVADETIEIRIIADSVDETKTQVVTVGTDYYIKISVGVSLGNSTFASSVTAPTAPVILSCKSLKIMYRKTTAAGANNTLIKAAYGQYV